MNNQYKLILISIALALVLLVVSFLSSAVNADVDRQGTGSAVAAPSPVTTGANTNSVKTGGGLRTVTFDTLHGTVKVNVPDDIRAGDTFSGTVGIEPNGQTEEILKKALDVLRTLKVEISPQDAQRDPRYTTTAAAHTVRMAHYSATDILFTMTLPPYDPNRSLDALGITLKGEDSTPGTVTIPLEKGWTVIPLERQAPTQPKAPSNPPSSNPSGTGNFQFPTLGQQGRPVEIFGPFDGDASNTTLKFVPGGATPNIPIRPLGESPRKIVFEAPTNFTGPAEMVLREGVNETRGQYRNVGVKLTAPKTNLMRGERTTLSVEVSGLEGIKEDVPLQLDAKGVINMDGGNFQNLRIKPQEVTKEGRYTTTRTITGQQAGGFTVTATVIVRPVYGRLQDDSHRGTVLLWNTLTGDYIFTSSFGGTRPGRPGGTVQPGGTTQPGGTGPPPIQPSGTTLIGIGKPVLKGCMITLSHNAPDRRIFARLDTCTKTGDASVETKSPKANFNITDKNTTDSTAASPPPK